MYESTDDRNLVNWLVEHRLLGIAVLASFVLLATVIIVTGPQAEPRERTEKAWPVSVISAEPQTLSPSLIAYGKVESRQVANLETSISAPVAEILKQEGEWVEEGDLLIRLNAAELELAVSVAQAEPKRRQAQLESAKTEFALAKRVTAHHRELKEIAESRLERYRNLYSSSMVSDAVLDEARQQASERSILLEEHLARLADFPNLIAQQQASVEESKARLDRAMLDLAQTEVRAPFDGRVIKALVSPGDRVLPGNPLARVADYGGLEVRASVLARIGHSLRQQLREGGHVEAVSNINGEQMRFTLDRLSGDVKSGQSGLDAFFKPEPGQLLDIGRVINLEVSLPAQQNVIALPVQSIYENNRIYRVEDDRLVGFDVEQVGDYIDEKGNLKVLVRSSEIQEGDALITTQLPRAISGLLVEPIDAGKFDQALANKPG